MSIGFIDSGIGGFTTLNTFRERYPESDFIYIADTLYAPYGCQSKEFVNGRAEKLVGLLAGRGADAAVFACNTLSVSTLENKNLCLPVIRVLPPLASMLSENGGKVLLLSTPLTASSGYVKGFSDKRLSVLPMKGLASLIEQIAPHFSILDDYLLEILMPYSGYDAAALGCTHYVWLEDLISRLFPEWKIYHGNRNAADEAAVFIKAENSVSELIVTGGNKSGYDKLFSEICLNRREN